MKKNIAIILLAAMMVLSCGCGANQTQTNTTAEPAAATAENKTILDSGKINLNALQALSSKEEFAKFIGVSDTEELGQMLMYIKNLGSYLPVDGEETATDTSWGTTSEGYNSLTIAQARALITPTLITTDNWKDFFETRVEQTTYYFYDENGDEQIEQGEEAKICAKSGYYFGNDLYLIFVNNATGRTMSYDGWFWPEEVTYEDGKFYNNYYGDDGCEYVIEINFDDYTCVWADGVAYSYELDPALRYIDEYDEETYESCYVNISEIDYDYDHDMECVFISDSDGEPETLVGYASLGSHAYSGVLEDFAADGKKQSIEINTSESLTLEQLLQCKTAGELAAAIGVANLEDMNQLLIYMNNCYYSLPSENESHEALSSYRISDEGFNSITAEEGRSMVTAQLVTCENWKEFIQPCMIDVDCISYDEDGNEICETNQEPAITINPDYHSSYGDVTLKLVDNTTGTEVSFDGEWYGEVSYHDDKYYVYSYDEDGWGKEVEFNIDNYTCILADGIVYEFELDHDLLYYEYYDEIAEEWIDINVDDYEGDTNEVYPMVFVQYGETNSDICRVGYEGLGSYVYHDCYFYM